MGARKPLRKYPHMTESSSVPSSMQSSSVPSSMQSSSVASPMQSRSAHAPMHPTNFIPNDPNDKGFNRALKAGKGKGKLKANARKLRFLQRPNILRPKKQGQIELDHDQNDEPET